MNYIQRIKKHGLTGIFQYLKKFTYKNYYHLIATI
jgi:hypothetical protein